MLSHCLLLCAMGSAVCALRGLCWLLLCQAVLGQTGTAPNQWPIETGCFRGEKEVSCKRVLLGLWAKAWSLAGLGRHGRGTGGHASVPGGQEGTGAEAGVLAGGLQGLLGSTLYVFIKGLCPQSSRCS